MKKSKQLVVKEYLRLYILLVVIYCYLEKKNYKFLKFDIKFPFTLKYSTSIFLAPPHLKTLELNKYHRRLLEEIRYATKPVVHSFCCNVVQY